MTPKGKSFKSLLVQLSACKDAIEWAGDMTIEEVVQKCQRGDWLLWLAMRIDVDDRKLALAKGECANTVRYLMKDEASIKAVDYGNGKISKEMLITAADAAHAAAAADAAHAAAAASDYAAASAAAAAADYAAAAAAADAAHAAYSAASDYARKEILLRTANICREIIGQLIIDNVKHEIEKQ